MVLYVRKPVVMMVSGTKGQSYRTILMLWYHHYLIGHKSYRYAYYGIAIVYTGAPALLKSYFMISQRVKILISMLNWHQSDSVN